MPRTVRRSLTLTIAVAALAATPAGAFQATEDSAVLPEFDARTGEKADVPASTGKARARIDGRLGAEATVSADRLNGGLRMLGTTNGLLTGPSRGDAADLALGYVAGHAGVFGLDQTDLDALRLAARYTSADGVTHLTWNQTDHGVPSYDTYLSVNVARDGSIINVTGAPVHNLSIPSADPALSASDSRHAAIDAAGGNGEADPHGLVIFASPEGDRLARRYTVWADSGYAYDVAVDASTGELLARHSITAEAGAATVFTHHPGAPSGGTQTAVNFITNGWMANGATTLTGQFTHTYADVNNNNAAGAGEEIAPDGGGDWEFTQTAVACGAQTPSTFTGTCTWNGTLATEPTNRSEATTNLFFFVNDFHDWLEAAPIGFNDASHNFEVGGTGGSDPVIAEANDGGGTNNANMSTPADGQSPRMQQYLFLSPAPAVNSSNDGTVVYHEYTHGLSNRLVGNGVGLGLTNQQGRAMGEGWSDWFAMDYLVENGLAANTADDGEIAVGEYVTNNTSVGIRRNSLDCPVGSSGVGCPGTATAGVGGFTFGDMGRILTYNASSVNPFFQVHADGEIWSETLWDLRDAVGAGTARGLIANGMRLAPVLPTYLDMRDAILMADAAAGGTNHAAIWQVFAERGMGFSAFTNGTHSTAGHEAFDLPPALAGLGKIVVADPAPLGDGDGVAEPGETARLTIPVRNTGGAQLTGVTGALTSSTPGVFVGQPNVSYGNIGGGAKANGTQYALTISSGASCTTVALNLALTSGQGAAGGPATLPLGTPGTTFPASGLPPAIPDNSTPGATWVLNIPASGTIDRIRVGVQTNHTWIGDLHGTLTSPSGRVVHLFERIGSDGFTVNQFGSNANGFNVTFDDNAAASIQGFFNTSTSNPGPTGVVAPNQPLARFAGDSLNGDWTLRMYDVSAPDTGSIQAFSIQAGAPACSTTATPPAAETTAATNVTSIGSTLNGTVNPAGAATDFAFDYGPTAAYGSRTATGSAGAGSTASPVSTAAPAPPGTHFRLLALRAGIVVAAGADQIVGVAGGGDDDACEKAKKKLKKAKKKLKKLKQQGASKQKIKKAKKKVKKAKKAKKKACQ